MNRVIGFSGPMGTGKTTAAQVLIREFGYQLLGFGDPVREKTKLLSPDGMIDKVRDRTLMQFLASYFRKNDPLFSVRAWKDRVGTGLIVADDVRYANEAAAIHALGGIVVRIESPFWDRQKRLQKRDGGLSDECSEHESERRGDWHDVEILNVGTVAELQSAMREILNGPVSYPLRSGAVA